jgi:hypothetical protein
MSEELQFPNFTAAEVYQWADECIREAQSTTASYDAWSGLVRAAWRYATLAADLAAQEAAAEGQRTQTARWSHLGASLDRRAPDHSSYGTSARSAIAA